MLKYTYTMAFNDGLGSQTDSDWHHFYSGGVPKAEVKFKC